ncbi:hypothetical protein F4808DRAFT_458370 [Astrocystis sublimbata]|nr:hypothetical protein F4808DRAFT_458370 [Astrocystis sublimbata]
MGLSAINKAYVYALAYGLCLTPCLASLSILTSNFTVTYGVPFLLQWDHTSSRSDTSNASAPDSINIDIVNYQPRQVVERIAANVVGNSYLWTPGDQEPDDYLFALVPADDEPVFYSGIWHYAGPTDTEDKVVGLSTGAKAGIGVGAGLGGLGVLSAAVLVLRRRRKSGAKVVAADNSIDTPEWKSELGADPKPRVELGGQRAPELPSEFNVWHEPPSELGIYSPSYRGP